MSAVGKIVDVLRADAPLLDLLPGGIHQAEISRQTTPQAFDAYSEVRPCAHVRAEIITPTGPHKRSARLFVLAWFYQQAGYDYISKARARVFELLHKQRFTAQDEAIYEISHADDLLEAEDPGLNVSMERSRYQVMIQR